MKRLDLKKKAEKRSFRRFVTAVFLLLSATAFLASSASAYEVIVDDEDAGFFAENSSLWDVSSGSSEAYNGSFHLNNNNNPGLVRWSPNFTEAGDYLVYMRWASDYATMDSSIPVMIYYENGNYTFTTTINQTLNGGQWMLLGSFAFQGTSNEYVEMVKGPGMKKACADAVRFVKVVYNSPPVAAAESITVNEGGTATTLGSGATSVLANDTDADGDALTAILTSDVSNGDLTLNSDGTFSYTHNDSETTSDSFTYKAFDGTDFSNEITVTITIQPVNEAPTPQVDVFVVKVSSSNNTLNVLANDSDPDGDSFSITAIDTTGTTFGLPPTMGTAVNNGTSITYTPPAVFDPSNPYDYLAYRITDSGGLSAVQVVVVYIYTINFNPIAVEDNFTVDEDSVNNVMDVMGNDFDYNVGDTFTVASILSTCIKADGNPSPATNGNVINNGGNVSYTPPANFAGDDYFCYRIVDNGGLLSNPVPVMVTVNGVNDAPVAVAENIEARSGATATALTSGATTVLANDTDVDGDTLTAVLVSSVSNGTLTLNSDGTFIYTHDGSSAATDSFTYKANDGTADSNVVTVSIAILNAGLHELSGASINDFTSYPINLTNSATPLVMLAASNDHQLYYKAYNDYSDLDGDNVADTTYKANIEYYGYFDSYKCYDYDSVQNRFEPVAEAGQEYYMRGQVTTFVPASGQVTFTVTSLQGNPGLGPFNNWKVTNETTGATGSSSTPLTLTNSGSVTFTTTANQWIANGNTVKVSVTMPSYCTGANDPYWSGNFLNWVSMSRMDVVRKVLFGGHRRVDSTAETVLERAYLPHDTHSWAKYYNGPDLARLTPFAENTDFTLADADPMNNGITFCNTTDVTGDHLSNEAAVMAEPPLIKVARGNFSLWAGNNRWQCTWKDNSPKNDHPADNGNDPAKTGIYAHPSNPEYTVGGVGDGIGQQNYVARVQACVPGLLGRERCKEYPAGDHKPIGLLQSFGDNDQLLFGMIAGTYLKHVSGGLVIKNIGTLTDEVDVNGDGHFLKVATSAGGPASTSSAGGLINAWSLYRIVEYKHGIDDTANGVYNDCPANLSAFSDVSGTGECTNWGNPFSEIYFQAVRYLSAESATGSYWVTSSVSIPGLPTPQPLPMAGNHPLNANNLCARLNIVALNSSVASYDFDELDSNAPGVQEVWNAATLPGADTSAAMTDVIGGAEGIHGNQYFVGETDVDNQSDGEDQLCTAKTVTSLGKVGGLCPEAPRLRGSYRVAGIAYYAHIKDIRADYLTGGRALDGMQKVDTYVVSNATATPEIGIPHPITGGDAVRILPACRNTSLTPRGNCTLTDFKIVSQTINDGAGNGSGTFYVSWDDSEQGGDNDQDMWGTIEYVINGNTNTLTLTTNVHAQSTTQAMGFGYVISGTTNDGFHAHSGINNFTFNDSANMTAGVDCSAGCFCTSSSNTNKPCDIGSDVPSTATYSLGTSVASELKEPLWYAAKWGYFRDSNGNDMPDLQEEWDSQDMEGNPVPDGIPDSYFLVSNPKQLEESLNRVFLSILNRTSSGTAAAVVSNNVRGEGAIYQAFYEPLKQDINDNKVSWIGTLQSLWLDRNGFMREDGCDPALTESGYCLSDGSGDKTLGGYDSDKVIETFFDPVENRTRVRRRTSAEKDRFTPFYMEGAVQSSNSFSGAVEFTVDSIGGSAGAGSFSTWKVINLTTGATGTSSENMQIAASGSSQTFDVLPTPASSWITMGDRIRVYHEENAVVDFEDLQTIWNAREQLSSLSGNLGTQRTYSHSAADGRFIKTWIDEDGDGMVDGGEFVDFTATSITPTNFTHFDLLTQPEVEGLVNYIRGLEIPGYRNREIDYDGDGQKEVMRLGDIINSSPTLVAGPAEAFDLLYRDPTYGPFRAKYQNRRNVLYAGANDGMLHAFNAGFFDVENMKFSTSGLKRDGVTAATAHPLGSELWAYVPMNLQPHLKWLKDKDYTHVYYIDGKPRVFDAKIFPYEDPSDPDSLHPSGWGTVLIVGMRFGGGKMTIDTGGNGIGTPPDANRISAYAIFDITDPEEEPQLLAEIQLPDESFTVSYPATVTVKDHDPLVDDNKWYILFGSGPENFETGESLSSNASIYILDMDRLIDPSSADYGGVPGGSTGHCALRKIGNPSGDHLNLIACDTQVQKSFVGTPITVDWDLNYKADTVYFGLIGNDTTPPTIGPNGQMMRFDISEHPDPGDWTEPSTLIDVEQPVYAAATAGIDQLDNKWIFFGTGRLFTSNDNTSTQRQSLYGLKDDGTGPLDKATDLADVTDTQVDVDGTLYNSPDPLTITTFDQLATAIDNDTYKGWRLDLPVIVGTEGTDPATRMLNQQALIGSALFSSVYQPSTDPCLTEGLSALYGLYFSTGTAYPGQGIFGSGIYSDGTGDHAVSNRFIELGLGLATSPAIHSASGEGGSGVSVFTQLSTGTIIRAEAKTQSNVRSGKQWWRER